MIPDSIFSWQEDIEESYEMETDEAEDPVPNIGMNKYLNGFGH